MKPIIFSILFLFSGMAQGSEYLKCLGKEELYIHKNKIGGAYKKLNQALIEQFLMFQNTVYMDADLKKIICSDKDQFPSIEIIKYVFMNKKIFSTKINSHQLREYSIDMNAIKDFKEESKFIFINFLTDMLSEVKDPHCLVKTFPSFKDFFLRTKYIMEDVGMEKLVSEIKDKNKIFNDLKDPSWKEKCR